MTGPWIVQCQRHGCAGRTMVQSRSQMLRQRYCSRRCAGKIAAALNPTSRKEFGALGGKASGLKRRQMMIARVLGLTPMAAYRKGRQEGWHAGYKAAVRRMAERRAA